MLAMSFLVGEPITYEAIALPTSSGSSIQDFRERATDHNSLSRLWVPNNKTIHRRPKA